VILDCSLAGRLRMRAQAIADLDAWLERNRIPLEGLESIEIRGQASHGAHDVRIRREGRVRPQAKSIEEYLPRSLWWYMTEGEAK